MFCEIEKNPKLETMLINLSFIIVKWVSKKFTRRTKNPFKKRNKNDFDEEKNISGGVVPWKTQVGGKYHCGPRTTWDPKSSRGGYGKLLENGADPICNPNSDKPCCSPYGFCGDTNAHCQYQDFSVLAKDKNEREWTTRKSGPDSLHGRFCQNT